MAMSSLRRTGPVEEATEDLFADFGENNITFTAIDRRSATALCENYPYEGQTIYQGNFEYEEPAQYGQGRSISIDFEFRSGSLIFILKMGVDIPINNLINELNSLSPNRFRIYRNLTPSREHLWQFFKNAEGLVEMTLLGPEGNEIEMEGLDEPLSSIAGKYPIESATAVYPYGEMDIVVRYTGGTINIDTDDPTANEYITQLFERDVIREGSD